MSLKEIQKLAIKFNKNLYLKQMCLPVAAVFVGAILTLFPLLINYITNKLILKYTYFSAFTLAECALLFFYGFAIYVLYCTFIIGEYAWYSASMTRKKNRFKRFIYWYKPRHSFKAFRLKVALLSLKLFWSIVFLLPTALMLITTITLAFNGGVEVYLLVSLLCGTAALFICGVIFRFIIVQRYFLASILLTQTPSLGVIQSIKQSKNLTEGQLLSIIKFKLIFAPMWLSCLLIFPIFFVYPHYKQSRTIIAKELML